MSVLNRCFSLCVFFLLAMQGDCFAQEEYGNQADKTSDYTASATSVNLSMPASSSTVSLANTRFLQLFPDAENVKWSTLPKGSVVSFLTRGQSAMAGFDQKGRMNYVITTCKAAQLPADFAKFISRKYSSYHLYAAKEVKAHGDKAYYAILEGKMNFVTLKYAGESIEIVQQVTK